VLFVCVTLNPSVTIFNPSISSFWIFALRLTGLVSVCYAKYPNSLRWMSYQMRRFEIFA